MIVSKTTPRNEPIIPNRRQKKYFLRTSFFIKKKKSEENKTPIRIYVKSKLI